MSVLLRHPIYPLQAGRVLSLMGWLTEDRYVVCTYFGVLFKGCGDEKQRVIVEAILKTKNEWGVGGYLQGTQYGTWGFN